MERTSAGYRYAVTIIGLLSLLQALSGQALAQVVQQPTVAPVITTSPITGTSTLDQLRATKADQIELQFPSGFTCRVAGGDTPAIVVYGDGGNLTVPSSGIQGLRAGMALIVPLYQNKRRLCDKAMRLQDALSLLEVAEKLVTAGAMTNDEYMLLATRIKEETLGVKSK